MTTDRATLRKWLERLTLNPLDPYAEGEDRYVALRDAGTGAVDEIYSLIELAPEPTVQLLSGPSGSGKTTELRRLAGRLREAGFLVVVVDVLSYVNQSSEVDITEFLIALALGLDEGLGPDEEGTGGSRWPGQFGDFLKRIEVSVGAGPVSAEASREGVKVGVPGLSAAIDFKAEVKGSQSFVEELRRKLAFHLGDLRQEVAAFCDGLVREFAARPEVEGVVMIVDSLEKVGGTTENEDRVQESIKRLFVDHSEKLRFASHHMVYTVPPYLLFTDPGLLPYDGTVRTVPIPHVRAPDGGESAAAIEALERVVARRITWQELLGDESLLRETILSSGGHLRALFRILQELIMLVNARGAPLPAERARVEEAIDKVAFGFASITQENADFLAWIHEERGGRVHPPTDQVGRMARLLHTHMLLGHQNGETWYEVHPLARRALGLE